LSRSLGEELAKKGSSKHSMMQRPAKVVNTLQTENSVFLGIFVPLLVRSQAHSCGLQIQRLAFGTREEPPGNEVCGYGCSALGGGSIHARPCRPSLVVNGLEDTLEPFLLALIDRV
jgi:hypothetical protein